MKKLKAPGREPDHVTEADTKYWWKERVRQLSGGTIQNIEWDHKEGHLFIHLHEQILPLSQSITEAYKSYLSRMVVS